MSHRTSPGRASGDRTFSSSVNFASLFRSSQAISRSPYGTGYMGPPGLPPTNFLPSVQGVGLILKRFLNASERPLGSNLGLYSVLAFFGLMGLHLMPWMRIWSGPVRTKT